MHKTIAIFLGLSVIIGSGIAHGLMTERWGLSDEPYASAARLEFVPRDAGKWEGTDIELTADQLAMAKVVGYVSRTFTNSRSGERITMLLVCGKPGTIATHPPDVCYTGAGFQPGPIRKYVCEVGDTTAEFKTADFRKGSSALAEMMRIFWAWSADGKWEAPNYPRVTYAPFPALFKLYFIRSLRNEDDPLDKDAIIDLIRIILPELQKSLFAPSPDSGSEE